MTNTAHQTDDHVLSRHIDAPFEAVRSLFNDLDQQPERIGRHRLHLDNRAEHEFPFRYRLSTRHAAAVLVEFRLSPSLRGGTELAWVVGRRRPVLWKALGGRSQFATAAAEFAARLTSMAEDRPTTRVEWADRGYELAA
jgi:hypothetical protein